MKKLASLVLALTMCLSLAACGGGVDKQPAIDAHNAAGAAVNELTAIINADPETYADYIDDMTALVDQLNQCGDYLGSDKDVEQSALDEWVSVCHDIEQWAKDAKAEIEAAPAPEPEPEPAPADDPASSPDGEESYENYTVLNYIELYNAPSAEDLAGTVWEFAGGFTDGRDLEADEANAILENYGGTLQIMFADTENASMIQGGGSLNGIYAIMDDGITVPLSFDYNGSALNYVSVFTTIGDDVVLVLLPAEDPSIAFYMTQAIDAG